MLSLYKLYYQLLIDNIIKLNCIRLILTYVVSRRYKPTHQSLVNVL